MLVIQIINYPPPPPPEAQHWQKHAWYKVEQDFTKFSCYWKKLLGIEGLVNVHRHGYACKICIKLKWSENITFSFQWHTLFQLIELTNPPTIVPYIFKISNFSCDIYQINFKITQRIYESYNVHLCDSYFWFWFDVSWGFVGFFNYKEYWLCF